MTLIASLISATIIFLGSVWIIFESVQKLIDPPEIKPAGMLIIACFGLLFNGLAMLKSKGQKSILSQVVSLHFLEDTLGWLAVLVGSVFIIIFKIFWLDPVLAILIAIYSIYNSSKLMISTAKMLIQAVPENVDCHKIKSELTAIPLVTNLHDLHIWTMDGEKNVLSLHLVLSKNSSLEDINKIKNEAKHRLQHANIFHSTIEIEIGDEDCEQLECAM